MTARNIVVVGGSAGAAPAVTAVLHALPADFPGTIFVVLHYAPTSGEDWLARLFAEQTRLSVQSPTDERRIEPGTIYIAQPDRHLIIKDGRVLVTRGQRENGWRPAIDVLFRSAAVAYGNRVVGVLTSGELDDGTSGLQAIKSCGGITVVQNPDDALHPAMLRTALANMHVDHSASLAEIPALLTRLATQDGGAPTPIPEGLRKEARMAEAPNGAPALTLWTAIRMFEQRANISRMLAEQERTHGRERRVNHYEGRAREAHRHATALRELHQHRRFTLDDPD